MLVFISILIKCNILLFRTILCDDEDIPRSQQSNMKSPKPLEKSSDKLPENESQNETRLESPKFHSTIKGFQQEAVPMTTEALSPISNAVTAIPSGLDDLEDVVAPSPSPFQMNLLAKEASKIKVSGTSKRKSATGENSNKNMNKKSKKEVEALPSNQNASKTTNKKPRKGGEKGRLFI